MALDNRYNINKQDGIDAINGSGYNGGTGSSSTWNNFKQSKAANVGLNVANQALAANSAAMEPDYINSDINNQEYQDKMTEYNQRLDQQKAAKDISSNVVSSLGPIGTIIGVAGGVNDIFTDNFSGKSLSGNVDHQNDTGFKGLKNQDLGEVSSTFNPFDNIGKATQAGSFGDAMLNLSGSAGIAKTVFGYETQRERERDALETEIENTKSAYEKLAAENSTARNTEQHNEEQANKLNSYYGVNSLGSKDFGIFAAMGGFIPTEGKSEDIIEAGGTHEQNPNGGVPVGKSGNNTALLEEGEVKTNINGNDYVFSNRLY